MSDQRVWVDERLHERGIDRTGELELVRERPWATVMRAETTAGVVWLKLAGAATAFEAPLYELLGEVVPHRILDPLGVDAERAWILLPDGGPTLGELVDRTELIDALVTVLPQYAELQRDLSGHVEEMLAAGVNDMRPALIPDRFEEALGAAAAYVAARGTEADRATLGRVAGLRPAVGSWAEGLGERAVPASIDHNDLHPWNVLVDRERGIEAARFYDWGDSVVAHPFASMLVPLGFVERSVLEPGADRRPLRRVRDAYLEAFGDLAPHAELVDTLELACRVATVARSLTWVRALGGAGPAAADDRYASAPLETLATLLGDSYLGGG